MVDPALGDTRRGEVHSTTLAAVNSPGERRSNRGWRLAASLLGMVALVVASVTVSLLDIDAPWRLVIYFAVIGTVLLGGTLWLVPSSRVKQMRG